MPAPDSDGSRAPDRAPEPSAGDAERTRIAGRAGIVAAGTLVSRALGMVREQALAALFPRLVTDAFNIAFLLPNVLRQLLAEGAVQNAVLPVLARTVERDGEGEARRYFRSVRGLSLVILIAVVIAGELFATQLVDAYAPGFRATPGLHERTVLLTRWCFPYIFFMGTAALGMAALNVHKRFVASSFAPGLLNVAFIAFCFGAPTWLLSRELDTSLALAGGVLVGGLLQVLAQWPSLRAIGYLQPPSFDFSHPGAREALRRMGPVLFGFGVYFLDGLVARSFLSEQGVGAPSWFNYAMRLCDFPQGIFVMALQTATLPSLALLAARGEHAEISRTFAFSLRLALFVALPATVLFVGLAEPIVVAFFQRGYFDAVSSRETAHALIAQGLGVWMVTAVRQLVAVYFALGDTRTPVIVATLDFAAFVALALLLRGPFGHVGVSLAITGSSLVQVVLLWGLLRGRLADVRLGEVARSAGRTLLALLPALLVGRFTASATLGALGDGSVGRALPGVAATLAFSAVFLLAARLLRSEELDVVVAPVLRRLRRG